MDMDREDMSINSQKIIVQQFENCPKNTRKSYLPKQKEWKEWCANKNYTDEASTP
ncbi:hypothetical protein BJ944DRAFT_242438 [Cunninghamella echinulata]|nr:hypothetical protein BJ944DRAFT_242438 [Cunninghamella echinulata]